MPIQSSSHSVTARPTANYPRLKRVILLLRHLAGPLTAGAPVVVDGRAGNAGRFHAIIQLLFGTTSVTVGISSGYAQQDGASVTLPPPPPPDPPMVAITVTNHDPTEKTFRVDVALTPAAGGDAIKDFKVTDLDIKDADEVELTFTTELGNLVAERATTNAYTAILKYGLLDKLPLTVTTKDQGS